MLVQALEPPHIPQRPALPCLGPRRRAPLTQVPADSMVSLPNLFIRLISLLCGANRTVNYSQQNKILIVHNYFGLLGDEIIWPQNQGREEEKSTECCKKKKAEGREVRGDALLWHASPACPVCTKELPPAAGTRVSTDPAPPCTALPGLTQPRAGSAAAPKASQRQVLPTPACKCARLREQRLVCRSC